MGIVNKHQAYFNGKPRPEYEAWCGMISRCYRKAVRSYYLYGGRGIQVCDEWRKSFSNFFDYIGPKPYPTHSLDRINSNGNYEPGNVRWATPLEQGQNTSRVRLLTKEGITLCAAEWERRLNLPAGILHTRLSRGWPSDKLFAAPNSTRADSVSVARCAYESSKPK